MRLLICGDRDWTDQAMIERAVLALPRPPSVIIHGCARGADTMAGIIALKLGIPVLEFPAEWDRHGRAAGLIRNKRMLVEGKPTRVFAFHNDLARSKGTKHMVTIAAATGVPVEVNPGG